MGLSFGSLLLVVLAVLFYVLEGIEYFLAARSRWHLGSAIVAAIVFFASSSAFVWLVVSPQHPMVAFMAIAFLAGVPLLALAVLAIDVGWGVFCTDTVYAVAIVWAFGFLLLVLDLLLLGLVVWRA